jgi:hypothetical protein
LGPGLQSHWSKRSDVYCIDTSNARQFQRAGRKLAEVSTPEKPWKLKELAVFNLQYIDMTWQFSWFWQCSFKFIFFSNSFFFTHLKCSMSLCTCMSISIEYISRSVLLGLRADMEWILRNREKERERLIPYLVQAGLKLVSFLCLLDAEIIAVCHHR